MHFFSGHVKGVFPHFSFKPAISFDENQSNVKPLLPNYSGSRFQPVSPYETYLFRKRIYSVYNGIQDSNGAGF
jgi:hypothetical protein